MRNETVDEALMLPNPFISGLLIHAWALRKEKDFDLKLSFFTVIPAPNSAAEWGRLETWNH